ncbi:hypothetical protein ACTPD8_06115 [Clostridioides difficile]|uniref:hypothetical protein n=1 Tax=Clostridioides difficile TaxID=1496 RepID=UPI0002D4FD8C
MVFALCSASFNEVISLSHTEIISSSSFGVSRTVLILVLGLEDKAFNIRKIAERE